MRLYKTQDGVEYPERVVTERGQEFINIRSTMRLDARPGECVEILTGFRIGGLKKKDKAVTCSSLGVGDTLNIENGKELSFKVCNSGDKTIMIYPGQVVGKLVVSKDAVK